jgi:hypothetical protein
MVASARMPSELTRWDVEGKSRVLGRRGWDAGACKHLIWVSRHERLTRPRGSGIIDVQGEVAVLLWPDKLRPQWSWCRR